MQTIAGGQHASLSGSLAAFLVVVVVVFAIGVPDSPSSRAAAAFNGIADAGLLRRTEEQDIARRDALVDCDDTLSSELPGDHARQYRVPEPTLRLSACIAACHPSHQV